MRRQKSSRGDRAAIGTPANSPSAGALVTADTSGPYTRPRPERGGSLARERHWHRTNGPCRFVRRQLAVGQSPQPVRPTVSRAKPGVRAAGRGMNKRALPVCSTAIGRRPIAAAPRAGVEPAAFPLGGGRSIHLSYRGRGSDQRSRTTRRRPSTFDGQEYPPNGGPGSDQRSRTTRRRPSTFDGQGYPPNGHQSRVTIQRERTARPTPYTSRPRIVGTVRITHTLASSPTMPSNGRRELARHIVDRAANRPLLVRLGRDCVGAGRGRRLARDLLRLPA